MMQEDAILAIEDQDQHNTNPTTTATGADQNAENLPLAKDRTHANFSADLFGVESSTFSSTTQFPNPAVSDSSSVSSTTQNTQINVLNQVAMDTPCPDSPAMDTQYDNHRVKMHEELQLAHRRQLELEDFAQQAFNQQSEKHLAIAEQFRRSEQAIVAKEIS